MRLGPILDAETEQDDSALSQRYFHNGCFVLEVPLSEQVAATQQILAGILDVVLCSSGFDRAGRYGAAMELLTRLEDSGVMECIA